MTRSTCNGCTWYRESLSYAGGMGCFRPKRFASGRIIHATDRVGFPVPFETHEAALYDGRADGDACGPDRIHWRAK